MFIGNDKIMAVKLKNSCLWAPYVLKLVFGMVCLIIAQSLSAQLEVEFETTENTNCAGSECDYDGPGILINEIMMSPFSGDGSLWGGNTDQRGEWIELYNPNFCEPVDISCYYLGNNANDGLAYPGGYVIPPGTVVPPAGFVLIRGVNAEPVPEELLLENGGNTIEIVVDNIEGDGVCVGGGSRLWFPNAGGWFAFYNNGGIAQDAVTWASQANQNMTPCVPPLDGCFPPTELSNYQDIPPERKNFILTETADLYQGQSIRRIPDGGEWSGPAVPTYGTCNDECVDLVTSTCNGTATLTVSGGSGEYVYEWNDAQSQTTATAVGLCGQEYCVLVVDGQNSTTACVTITEPSYESDADDSFCEGDSYILPDSTEVNEAGTYEMMLLSDGGCDSLVTLDLEQFPSYSFELNPEICENSSFTLPDGQEVNEPGTYTVNFELETGCDSTYTVNLSVDPVVNVNQEVSICDGNLHTLPDGSEVGETGIYEVPVGGVECDTLFVVDLNVDPSYFIQSEASICEGESHQLPDGTLVDESGVYTIELQTEAGCDSTLEALVLVNPLPVINIPMQAEYCYQPGTITVDATPAGGTLSGVLVDENSNTIELDNAPPGNYSVNYSYTDENGCSNSDEHTYSILQAVEPQYTFGADCFNVAEFSNLTADPEDELEYSWFINDSLFSTEESAQYAYNEEGEYTVTLVATNTAGCPYSYSEDIFLEEGLQLAEYWLPDIITPNGDQLNQYLRLMPDEKDCIEYRITIFNRWGKKVYEMTDSSTPFSGQNDDGITLDEGVYYYLLESPQIDCSSSMFDDLCKGSVHVFR